MKILIITSKVQSSSIGQDFIELAFILHKKEVRQ